MARKLVIVSSNINNVNYIANRLPNFYFSSDLSSHNPYERVYSVSIISSRISITPFGSSGRLSHVMKVLMLKAGSLTLYMLNHWCCIAIFKILFSCYHILNAPSLITSTGTPNAVNTKTHFGQDSQPLPPTSHGYSHPLNNHRIVKSSWYSKWQSSKRFPDQTFVRIPYLSYIRTQSLVASCSR
jgi:hypothetical protein